MMAPDRHERLTYCSLIDDSHGKTRRHGFFVVSRTIRWRLDYPNGERSEWLSNEETDQLLERWDREAGTTLAEAREEVEREREEFIAATEFKIVSVHNPNPFQVEYRKPTFTFPDGSTMQFEEGVPEEQIKEAMAEAAREAHPDPTSRDRPVQESVRVWEREILVGESRRSLPDIFSWDYSFPMADVIATLDELAREGWSVLSTSEDRGLYASKLADNVSAPLCVRYLLAQDGPNPAPR
jgi:phosphoglycolate phosphatase-like HAD superfamily hydrolase